MNVRKAIVTGGSTGIGRATAVQLAKSGHDVAITYAHNSQEAEQTAQMVQQTGRRCSIHELDLTSPDTAHPVVDEMVDQLGGLGVLVNNAGLMIKRKLADVDLENVHKIFDVNALGAVMVIQRAITHLLPAGMDGPARSTPGRIVVVTSVHERIASPVDPLYTMTKHALGGLVKCLSLDLTPLNVTVNAVAPGEIATPMNDMRPEDANNVERPAIPARRAGRPEEVAAVIDFLASSQADFVTGVSWPVDGGFEATTPLAASAYREAYLEASNS